MRWKFFIIHICWFDRLRCCFAMAGMHLLLSWKCVYLLCKTKKKIVWKAKDFLFVEDKIPSRYFQYILSQYFIYILTWQTTNVFKEAEQEPEKSLGEEKRQEWWIWVKLMGGILNRESWGSKKGPVSRIFNAPLHSLGLFPLDWRG